MSWRFFIRTGGRALAYDATLALIEAIKLQSRPTRKGTIAKLRSPGFSVIGATGKIEFNTPKNGDRLDFAPTLVRLFVCEDRNVFVPTAIDDDKAANLACN